MFILFKERYKGRESSRDRGVYFGRTRERVDVKGNSYHVGECFFSARLKVRCRRKVSGSEARECIKVHLAVSNRSHLSFQNP